MTCPRKTNKSLFDLRKSYTCIQLKVVSYVDPKLKNETAYIGNYLDYPVDYITGLDYADVSINKEISVGT